LVYGDHGRVLAGWLPGDRVAAAETLVELRGGRAFRRPSLVRGLPTDARGYVRGELRLGGSADDPWLVRTEVRYSLVKRGPLFEREPSGYRFDAGWRSTSEPVTMPVAARRLPELSEQDTCGEGLHFVPLTWAATPRGGLVVAGRCDDERAANYPVTTLMVAYGAPHGVRWNIEHVPFSERLNGIVNLSVSAPRDDEILLSAYEPFKEPEERIAFLARFDGTTWSDVELKLQDGIMSVAADGQGTVWLAAGRALYRMDGAKLARVPLPSPHFVERGGPVQVRSVRYLDGELWVEGAYLVRRSGERGTQWASVLYSTRRPDVPLHCDAREPAESALSEAVP